MKRLLFVLSFLIIYSCNNSKQKTSTLSDFISETSSVVIKIDHVESFKTDWNNNTVLAKITSSEAHQRIENQVKNLNYLNTNAPVLIGFESIKDSITYTLATKLTDSLFVSESIDSTALHYKVIDSFLVMSNSQTYLNVLKPKKNNKLEKLLKTSKSNTSFSLLLNEQPSVKFAASFFNKDFSNFASQSVLDVDLSQDRIKVNGISVVNDTLPKITSIFNNTIAQENALQHIVPSNAEGYLGFTFNDFQIVKNNIDHYKAIEIDSTYNPELFQTINEAGQIFYNNQVLLALKSIDVSATEEALRDHQIIVSSYRNIPIFEFTDSNLFSSLFHPVLNLSEVNRYIIIDDFFVFANSEEGLHYIITNHQNGNTLSENAAYKDAMLHLSDESTLIAVSNSLHVSKQIAEALDVENINLDDNKISIFQLIQDDTFTHINGIIQKHKARKQRDVISEEFVTSLDADIVMNPYFVTNHRTKGKDIVVQDANNTLYLISNNGQILWKKQLNGNILGRIEQVDLYKNGRLQLAFATPKRVYVLDRNGNDVSPFPLKFNDDVTQPLSVFDYDNNKRYRFLVTQGENLLMYDKHGKTVNGFNYKASGNIKTQPKHFRIYNKDYIVFAANNSMQILDRRGKIRIKPNATFNFSEQPIFEYKDHFTTTNINGALIQVSLKGQATSQNIGLDQLHYIDATKKSLVTLTENKLGIKRKTIELDFGDYTSPKIFYLNDKIYVSLTDRQTQKIYMFDSQTKGIANFPVYGNSTIDLSNMDEDRFLELVTKGESNSIIVYEKN